MVNVVIAIEIIVLVEYEVGERLFCRRLGRRERKVALDMGLL